MGELLQAARPRTPHDDLVEKEVFERLDGALETLPTEQKTVFVLAEFLGVPYEEIAEIEGVKIGTIRSRISRAKGKLRWLLRDYVGETA